MSLQPDLNLGIPATAAPKKVRKLSDIQILVSRLVSMMKGSYDKAAWGRESRLAKTLITRYGRDFMMWVPPPENHKVNSLMWFFDQLGKNYLSDQLVEYKKQETGLSPQKEEIVLAPDKIGEDILITKKPKTLKDFLNLYGKETS
jgi:hypothetical protein